MSEAAILAKLCDLDLQIWSNVEQISQIKAEISSFLKDEQGSAERFASAQKQQKEHECLLKQLELDLAEVEQEQKKLEAQRMQAATGKSLQAIESRITQANEKKDELEIKWLELSEKVEVLAENTLKQERCCSTMQKNKESFIAERSKLAGEAQREYLELKESRPTYMDGLSSWAVGKYEKKRKACGDKPVIFAVKDTSCPGCHMNLSDVDYSRVRYEEQAQICSHCGVLLFWKVGDTGE